jgi:cobalt-zinc-cadmium efflux system protein
MTAHLITPGGHPDDAFYRHAADVLLDRFEITHVTLQVVREPFMPLCGEVAPL